MNMTKTIMFLVAALAATTMWAERPLNPAYRANRAKQLAAQGGLVTKVTAGKSIKIVNAQKKVKSSALNEVATLMTGMMSLPVVLVETSEIDPSKLLDGDTAAVVVVREDVMSAPRLLVAPEDCWAVVNVTALAADGTDANYVQIRTAKEVYRALALVLGASDSMMQPSLMAPIHSIKDLDANPCIGLSPDTCNKMIENAGRLGVEMRRRTTYKRACEEGWAPAPTNDVQRAIWKKVHELPTEPIKIKPEAKKVGD